MKYYARIGDKTYECFVEEENDALFVRVDGKRYRADLTHVTRARSYSLLLDGRSYEFALEAVDGHVECSGAAGQFEIVVEDARTHAARKMTAGARGAAGPRVVKAVMPGIVREVLVEVGSTLGDGAALVILEAMKMQNEIRTERGGLVLAVHVEAAQTVDKGAKLVTLE